MDEVGDLVKKEVAEATNAVLGKFVNSINFVKYFYKVLQNEETHLI